jgi:hypothetical protein
MRLLLTDHQHAVSRTSSRHAIAKSATAVSLLVTVVTPHLTLHLRAAPTCSLLVFEQARNYLQFEQDRYDVIGGFLSPVHDAYGKSSLIPQKLRYDMCVAAVKNSSWLSVQEWEMKQKGWTTTAETLCKYQEALNRAHLTEGPPPCSDSADGCRRRVCDVLQSPHLCCAVSCMVVSCRSDSCEDVVRR